jgi:hypothetical protein
VADPRLGRIRVDEWRVPGHEYAGSAAYDLYISKDGKTLRTGNSGATMRRIK